MSSKTGAGSHNRDVIAAKKNYLIHEGKTQSCGCLYHKRKDKTNTVILSSDCNRRKVVETQGWCRNGKTLIDKLKHQGWRLIHVILLSTIETKYIYNSYVNGLFYITSPENLPLKCKFKTIFDSVEMKNFLFVVKNKNITIEDYFKASSFLEKELSVSRLGFYNVHFKSEELAITYYDQLIKDLSNITSINVLNELKYRLCELIQSSKKSYHIKESSDKSIQHSLKDISFNWSKMNNIFLDSSPKHLYRGPFHNTKVKSSNCTRMMAYLTESRLDEAKIADIFISNNKQSGFHIDHIIPLALGGRHNIENLQILTDTENLIKKDRLRFKDYLLMKNDKKHLNNMVCSDFYDIMMKLIEKVGDDENIFNKVIYQFEQDLKIKKYEKKKNFEKLTAKDKFNYIQLLREDLAPHSIKQYIARYNRKETGEIIIT